MKKTKDELINENSLCNYCKSEPGVFGTPNGYSSCEGNWCDEAYENYLDEYEEGEEQLR